MRGEPAFFHHFNVFSMNSISSTLPDGGAQVYAHFGFDCTTSEKVPAPIITGGDPKPCLSFRRQSTGDYVFSLWTTGDKGDCVKFVQLMHKCSAGDAARFVRGLYESSGATMTPAVTRSQATSVPRKTRPAQRIVTLHYSTSSISKNAKASEYFQRKAGGHITAEVLDRYGVGVLYWITRGKAVPQELADHVWDSGNKAPVTEVKEIDLSRTQEDNPMICYESDGMQTFGDFIYCQVKAPFTNLDTRTWRYLSACAYVKADRHELLYWFGFRQLPDVDTVFLTEGENDCLALNAIGFPAVTFGGGIAKLNDLHLMQLKGKKVRRVVAVFDIDAPGKAFASGLMQQAPNLRREHGIEVRSVTLPKLSGTKDSKDVCDYLSKYGADDDLLNALISWKDGDDTPGGRQSTDDDEKQGSQIAQVERKDSEPTQGTPDNAASRLRTYTRRGDDITMTRILVKGTVLEAREDIVKALYMHRRVQLCAATGRGKTFAAVDLGRNIATGTIPFSEEELRDIFGGDVPFTEADFRTVIIQPTALAVHQGSKKYGVTGLCSLTDMNEDTLRRAQTDSLVLTTYDSLHKCGKIDLLIVDEVHEISKAYNYRAEAVTRVHEQMSACRYVLAITATPEPVLTNSLNFHTLQIETAAKQRLVIAEHYVSEMQTASCICEDVSDNEDLSDDEGGNADQAPEPKKGSMMLDRIATWCKDVTSRGSVAVVRLNSKRKIKALKAYLEGSGLAGVHTMTRDQKDLAEPVYQSIIEESRLPGDCTVLLSTCVLDTAVNIEGERIEVLFVCDGMNKDADNIVQFAARFRHMTTLNVNLLFQVEGKRTVRAKTASQEYAGALDIQTRGAEYFNDQVQELGAEVETKNGVVTVNGVALHDKAGVTWNKDDQRFTASKAWCLNYAIRECSEKTSADTLHELAAMHAAGITSVSIAERVECGSVCDLEGVENALRDITEKEADQHRQVLAELVDNEVTFVTALNSVSKDMKLKAKLQHQYGTMLLAVNDASEDLTKTHGGLLREQRTEKIVKQYLEDIDDGFGKDDAVTLSGKLAGSNSRTMFKAHLKALQCLHTPAELLGKKDKGLKNVLADIVAAFQPGERVSSEELRRRVVDRTSVDTLRVQEKNIVSLVRVLFGAQRCGRDKAWKIGEIETVEGFCQRFGVKPPREVTRVGDTSRVYIL